MYSLNARDHFNCSPLLFSWPAPQNRCGQMEGGGACIGLLTVQFGTFIWKPGKVVCMVWITIKYIASQQLILITSFLDKTGTQAPVRISNYPEFCCSKRRWTSWNRNCTTWKAQNKSPLPTYQCSASQARRPRVTHSAMSNNNMHTLSRWTYNVVPIHIKQASIDRAVSSHTRTASSRWYLRILCIGTVSMSRSLNWPSFALFWHSCIAKQHYAVSC